MSLRYKFLSKQPQVFSRLVGVGVDEYDKILEKLTPLWEKKVLGAYKRPGRHFKLEVADMLMMLFIYYRSYITHAFLGHLFGIDDSRVCRIFRPLEPLVARIVSICKERKLHREEIEEILMDATEQSIERPKKNQKSYYSGKKKRHTLKTEIRSTLEGRIVNVSKSYPGSEHDFMVYKKGRPIARNTRAFVDSGYQGLDKLHQETELPYKASKHKPLDEEDKFYNRALSRIRVKIENVIAQLKQFRILSDRFRNKRRAYNLKVNIIAGLVNLKNGFEMAL
jgi:hypothetical protein